MTGRRPVTGTRGDDAAVTWHDVECAGYRADLPLWRELAAEAGGSILELGAGTGRVALDLAEQGHEVTGLDSDPALVAELRRRARGRGVSARAVAGDARTFELGRRFALIIAPMQLAQLLGGPDGRRSMLASARRHLDPGGRLVVALADPLDGEPSDGVAPPLPDVREADGWVFSSTPVGLRTEAEGIAIDRLRQAVSPSGELSESMATVLLDTVEPAELEATARDLALEPLDRRTVPDTAGYVGGTVVVLEPAR